MSEHAMQLINKSRTTKIDRSLRDDFRHGNDAPRDPFVSQMSHGWECVFMSQGVDRVELLISESMCMYHYLH